MEWSDIWNNYLIRANLNQLKMTQWLFTAFMKLLKSGAQVMLIVAQISVREFDVKWHLNTRDIFDNIWNEIQQTISFLQK